MIIEKKHILTNKILFAKSICYADTTNVKTRDDLLEAVGRDSRIFDEIENELPPVIIDLTELEFVPELLNEIKSMYQDDKKVVRVVDTILEYAESPNGGEKQLHESRLAAIGWRYVLLNGHNKIRQLLNNEIEYLEIIQGSVYLTSAIDWKNLFLEKGEDASKKLTARRLIVELSIYFSLTCSDYYLDIDEEVREDKYDKIASIIVQMQDYKEYYEPALEMEEYQLEDQLMQIQEVAQAVVRLAHRS